MKPSELIRKYGWIQGRLGDEKQGFCLIGSIRHACGSINNLQEVINKLQTKIGTSLITWNDTMGRTKEDVIILLESIGE